MSLARTSVCSRLAVLYAVAWVGVVALGYDVASAADQVAAIVSSPTPTPTPAPGSGRSRSVGRDGKVARRQRPHGLLTLGGATSARGGAAGTAEASPTPACVVTGRKPDHAEQYGYNPNNVLAMGRGFDPEHPFTLFQNCLQFDGRMTLLDTPEGVFHANVVKTRAELYNLTGVDLSASANFSWGTGGASFNAASQQAQSVSFAADSVAFYVQARLKLGRVEPRTALSLKPEFQALLDAGRNAEFINRCGSAYIGQQVTEANFTLVYNFSNVSQQGRDELTRSFGAAFTTTGTSAGGEAAWFNAVERVSDMSQTNVAVFTKGGNLTATTALYYCLVTTDLYDVAAVRKCLADKYLGTDDPNGGGSKLGPSDGAPLSYNAGSMTTFGLSGCFQQGLRNRDAKLAAIQGELEDANATVNGLTVLAREVSLGLIPQVANETATLLSKVDNAKRQFASYSSQLECLARRCAGDAANDFANCQTPAQAQANPPRPARSARPRRCHLTSSTCSTSRHGSASFAGVRWPSSESGESGRVSAPGKRTPSRRLRRHSASRLLAPIAIA